MRILIVDDDEVSRLTLTKLLARYGECVSAQHGREAVALFKEALAAKRPYRLVCMDIQMPVMDGHEALKLIREVEKELGVKPGHEAKVVMVTCHDDMKNVCTSFFQGQATCYFTKPIDFGVLVETLTKEGVINNPAAKA